MSAAQIIYLVCGILLIQAVVWAFIFRWIRGKSAEVKGDMEKVLGSAEGKILIGPESAVYRGADKRFGNIRGNGVICLTANKIIFKKLVGRDIEIDRSDIAGATVEDWFKGKTSFATGAKHLVIKTQDGNRIGFLIKDAPKWARAVLSANHAG
ncbi:MAG: hypothetical protein ACOZBW_00945 [Thermodesulfobacteriota bacterium]